MIKKMVILAVSVSLFLLLICINIFNNNDEAFHRSESKVILNDLSDITMTVESITDTKITVCINSSSDVSVIFGEDYIIEVKDGQKWYSLPVNDDIMFTSMGYELKRGSSFQWSVDSKILYGRLAPGEYRIIKGFRTEPQQDPGKDYFISAEFSL
ncbi:immunoglobulin-like domain-containing protein [Lacrimispora xylanisolvens]|uniref:immunoglobulin-like domain-containing protein n=1 Tax=Lacrimispora xylanisolvens TaxID=384636 RepID=UPI002402C2D2|nr:hypothetical protein [Paenibacillaceae bacterium]